MDTLETYTPQISVLGGILLEPKRMGEAMTVLSADDFTAPNCRVAWSAMVQIFRDGKTVDPILLKDALSGFENAGQFVMDCMEAAPYAGNFPAHVEALKKQSMLSRLRDLGSELSTCTDADDALALISKANSISIQRQARTRRTMAEMLQSFADRHAKNVVPNFLRWPVKDLNDGLHIGKGKFVVLGGYPSDGKTAFALQSALCQAAAGVRTAFYSLETDVDTAEDRVNACTACIDLGIITRNKLSNDDWQRFAASSKFASLPFCVIEAAEMSVDDIRADALANRYEVIYVDYLQLIRSARNNSHYSRFDEVSEISRSLQRLAKTTGITVVALSQLTRPQNGMKGEAPAPTMHNLRESGQIEQDADAIMLLYRKEAENVRSMRIIRVAKNKEGLTGTFPVAFDGAHQRFAWVVPLDVWAGVESKASNRRPRETKKPEQEEQTAMEGI